MSAAQFVLYFNTVNAFTSGIGRIMTDLAALRRQSFDICAVREFLEYPETFPMEEGSPVTPDLKIPYQIELRAGLSTSLYKDFDENGVDISGGEAQKIALARALYKDAPFVILDEPTAALDPVAEFEVYSRMNQLIGQKSAVFISHRLSSCRFCDDIAVFHEGRLIQRGSHDALVGDRAGMYYQLWSAQAQYYAAQEESVQM